MQELLREIVSRGATGIIFDRPLETPDGLVRLISNPIPVDLESDVNRLLTEQRSRSIARGTELGRVLQEANSLGVDVEQVLKSAAAYLEMDVAVIGSNAELDPLPPPHRMDILPSCARSTVAAPGVDSITELGWRVRKPSGWVRFGRTACTDPAGGRPPGGVGGSRSGPRNRGAPARKCAFGRAGGALFHSAK